MTGADADGLSASYAEGKRDGRAEACKTALGYTDRITVLLRSASAALEVGNMPDAAHYLGNGQQVLSNLGEVLRR